MDTCRKCGEKCAGLVFHAFVCDNCGDEYRVCVGENPGQLETELADAQVEIERLKFLLNYENKLIEQTREALARVNAVSSSFPGFYFEHGEDSEGNECESISECVRAALEAAERGDK